MKRASTQKSRVFISIVVLSAGFLAPAAFADEKEDSDLGLTVQLGYEKTVGKYGQRANTTTSTSLTSITYDSDDYAINIDVPYLEQRGPGRVFLLPRRRIIIVGSDRVASGIGDVTSGYTRYVLNEEDDGVDLDLGGIVKFATASASKGLGTGKADFSLQSVLSESFGDFHVSGTLGYTFVGKPANLNYRNAVYAAIDGSYKITSEVSAGVTVNAGGSIIPGQPRTRDTTAYLDFSPLKKLKVGAYYLVGHSTQSPDRGAGITVTASF